MQPVPEIDHISLRAAIGRMYGEAGHACSAFWPEHASTLITRLLQYERMQMQLGRWVLVAKAHGVGRV